MIGRVKQAVDLAMRGNQLHLNCASDFVKYCEGQLRKKN